MSSTSKKSLEQKLAPFIYNRIYSINKGLLRVLILIIYSCEIALFIDLVNMLDHDLFLLNKDNYNSRVFHLFLIEHKSFNYLATTKREFIVGYLHYLIFASILYYLIYWTAIRLLLWIYDGFKKE